MKHRKKGRKFGRENGQRKALMRGLAANLVLREKIVTTEAKAKEVRPFVEKLITKSRKQNLASIKYLAKRLPIRARKKIIELSKQYQNRPGGYTRIVRLGQRMGDGAKMAIIEFVK